MSECPATGAPRICCLRAAVCLLGALSAASGPALAQAPQPVPAALAACAQIESDRQRLRCYDAALQGAPAADAVSARERAAREAPGAEATGREAPTGGSPAAQDDRARASFGLDAPPDRPERIEVVVAAVAETLSGTARFTTDDGQVWQQTSSRTRRYAPPPFMAVIEAGSADSYFLTPAGGGLAVRVSRVR